MAIRFNDNKKLKISVIGLGYVGLPLAVEFGRTRPVIGFDIDEQRIKELEQEKKQLQDTIHHMNDKL